MAVDRPGFGGRHWLLILPGRWLTRLDSGWRVSCDTDGTAAVLWSEERPFDRKYFATVDLALASLDGGQTRS